MQTELETTEKPVSIEYTFRRYQPLLHVLAAVVSVSVTWYVATATSAQARDSRTEQQAAQIADLNRRFDELSRKQDATLTKEMFEIYQKKDADRNERTEKLLMQILNESR